ncbi:proline iminopeptidase-family hydrolase [Deinococcus ruber]|uniref:AB hydrolase-1 domain-containing protein n=1 Tax=Deinococcus ruber TaxID=1848197 RepID=A0A918CLW5_9DEIO|nr:proline iminopeptidase-family hydrolase [Deinococcus ruber]GGR31728.1 hypothetical protein GCM10008957_47910 [Deinococcus ruber]
MPYHEEVRLADHIARLLTADLPPLPLPAVLPKLTSEQRAAVQLAGTTALYVITGGPGTGKTTTLKALLDTLDTAGLSTILCAPSGKAASRMQQTPLKGFSARCTLKDTHVHRGGTMQQWHADREGTIDFAGFHIWYGMTRTEDAPGSVPLLVIHGGPGMPHDALEPLAELSDGVRRVIFYDQLGCGKSDRPSDPDIYSLGLFVQELQTVRDTLGLTRVHLYGHSFGGALALQYALSHPAGLESVIIADSFATADGWLEGAMQLRQQMPPEVRQLLEAHEAAGTTSDPAYQAAFGQYYLGVHCCRVPIPDHLQRAFAGSGAEVYRAMYGPQWFQMTGQYRGWNVVDRLSDLHVPTLVLAGRYDQCVPTLSQQLQANIPGAELKIFEHSSHVPFIEEPDEHHRWVRAFLRRVEMQAVR